MAINNTLLNLNQGIEGLAQSPAQSRSLEVLPQSQRVLPSNSTFIGQQVDLQNVAWLQSGSQWQRSMQAFVMPNINSDMLEPAEFKKRLDNVRKKSDKMAREQKSPELRALADALQDDLDLQEILHQFRAALVRI